MPELPNLTNLIWASHFPNKDDSKHLFTEKQKHCEVQELYIPT